MYVFMNIYITYIYLYMNIYIYIRLVNYFYSGLIRVRMRSDSNQALYFDVIYMLMILYLQTAHDSQNHDTAT